jgi:4'-phosphopantetheinyl transferase
MAVVKFILILSEALQFRNFPSGFMGPIRLAKGQVAVWTTALDDVSDTRFRHLADLLSHDETQRAFRFHFERDRKRFIVCRGVLREMLATYLDRNPKNIDFSYGPQGKPYWKDSTGVGVGSLCFNVSHSSGWAIYALGFGEVGVDLEFVRPVPELEALVERFFSAAERSAFWSVPASLKLRTFFACWTRKEAYVKACGGGLLIPLDQFDVSVDPDLPARLLSAAGAPEDQLPWALHSFDLATGGIAALVCPRYDEPNLCGSWPQLGEIGQEVPSQSEPIRD